MIMRGAGAVSYPELASSSKNAETPTNPDITFEGIPANVKLLLKIIHEQSHASNIGGSLDDRRTQRVAGMIAILDDVKTRIQKYSTPVRKSLKEFRRCNTDLRPQRCSAADVVVIDEKDKLRRELHASTSARKSLEAICCSLGKEKKIMSLELTRKVHQFNEMKELINDLKAQNQTLLTKVRACVHDHNFDNNNYHHSGCGGMINIPALQDQNKALPDQLFKSLDRYRSLKRKYKDAKKENVGIQTTMEDIGFEVAQGLGRLHGIKQQLATEQVQKSDIEKEISELQCMFQSFNMKILKLQMRMKV